MLSRSWLTAARCRPTAAGCRSTSAPRCRQTWSTCTWRDLRRRTLLASAAGCSDNALSRPASTRSVHLTRPREPAAAAARARCNAPRCARLVSCARTGSSCAKGFFRFPRFAPLQPLQLCRSAAHARLCRRLESARLPAGVTRAAAATTMLRQAASKMRLNARGRHWQRCPLSRRAEQRKQLDRPGRLLPLLLATGGTLGTWPLRVAGESNGPTLLRGARSAARHHLLRVRTLPRAAAADFGSRSASSTHER